MKKRNIVKILSIVFFLTFIAVSSDASYAKTVKVPSSVKAAFQKKFPKVKKVKWSIEKNHIYKATFRKKGDKFSVKLKATVKWVKTIKVISKNKLPSKIQKEINNNYPKAKILTVFHLWTPSGQSYLIDIKLKGNYYDLKYSSTGKLFIKKKDNY